MSNELQKQERPAWENQIELIKDTVAVGASNAELELFLYQAKRTGLDPLSRQIHFVKRGGRGTIQTGIDGYRLIADRTGKYAGNDDYMFDEGLSEYMVIAEGRDRPTTATATVYKLIQNGERVPFSATARWEEYYPGEKQGYMWKKMPFLMLGKTAETLALRKAFPVELSGLYTDEEMEQADAVTPAPRSSDNQLKLTHQIRELILEGCEGDETMAQKTEAMICKKAGGTLEKISEKGLEKIRVQLIERLEKKVAEAVEEPVTEWEKEDGSDEVKSAYGLPF